MYMDSPTSWGLDTRRSFEPNHCKMSSSSSGQHNSLPPLQQAIPEFHSHNPQERRESSIPRTLAEHSPTFKSPSTHQTHQHSHSHPAYPPHRTSPPSKYGEASPAEVYDAQTYLFPDAHARRISTATTSTTSTQAPPYHQPQTHHPSPYLPPVSSMTSSRGSSLDMEPSENPYHPHRYTTTPSSTSPTSYRAPSPPYYGTPHNHHNSPDFERPGKRRRGNLPKQVTDLLRAWLNEHLHHPYPTEDEKQMLMAQTGLTIHQISNWFINARRRRLPAIASSDKSSGSRRPSSGQL